MANKKQGYVTSEEEFNKYLNTMKANAEDRGIRLLYSVATAPWLGTTSTMCNTTNTHEEDQCTDCMISALVDTCELSVILEVVSDCLHHQGRELYAILVANLADAIEILERNAKIVHPEAKS